MHVVVGGAGIAGLTLAAGLRAGGVEVTLVEEQAHADATGAGLSLWPNALAALDRLGLGEPVRAISATAPEACIVTRDGRVLSRVTAGQAAHALGEAPRCVHRAELVEVLEAAAGEVRFGAGVTGVVAGERTVGVRTAAGDVVEGDVLVGADGVRSAVAAHLDGAATASYAGYTAWRGTTTTAVAGVQPGDLPATEAWGRGERFGIVPLTGGRVYWFATAGRPEGERAPHGEWHEVLDRFAGWHDPVVAVLKATDPDAVLRHDVYDRTPLARWSHGRIGVIGDAAHPMQPNLGQGACQAIEDAVRLVELLSGDGADPASALASYERERRPPVERIVAQARRIGRVAQASSAVGAVARDAVVRATPASATLRSLRRFAAAR